jgi:hypothetical protein
MLHLFLSNRRNALLDRCLLKVAQRCDAYTDKAVSLQGVPVFLDVLIRTLQVQKRALPVPAGGGLGPSGLGHSVKLQGGELSGLGLTHEHVVHSYGDLCQAITELASEHDIDIATEEILTVNQCLDHAIADAVTGLSEPHRVVNGDESQTATGLGARSGAGVSPPSPSA